MTANSSTGSTHRVDQAPSLQLASSQTYRLRKTCFQRHYEVLDVEGKVQFYGKSHGFSTNKPDVILHAGSSENGAIIAACKFLRFSATWKICLGDPDDPVNNQWEDMIKETFQGSQYRVEITTDEDGDQSLMRRSFLWKRTRSVVANDLSISKLSSRNYKLVDERTGDISAVFTSQRTYRECGTLQITSGYGQRFEKMALVTCLSLYEKARRRNQRGSGDGGGGT